MADDAPPEPSRLMPRAQRRFLEVAERIRLNQPTFDDLAYMARELVQVTLPHRNPGDVPAWSRSNGNLTMTVQPGWDHQRRKPFGYPYGSIPRLLLFWLTAEAVQKRNRQIELGSSLSDFMFQLGLNPRVSSWRRASTGARSLSLSSRTRSVRTGIFPARTQGKRAGGVTTPLPSPTLGQARPTEARSG